MRPLLLLALALTGCPDTTSPTIGGATTTRVCSVDELIAFREASELDERTDLWIAFVDVGHGDAIWIRTPGARELDGLDILVDTGDARVINGFERQAPDGIGALIDFMSESGWPPGSPIHYLVVTHPDSDHHGGASRLLDEYAVSTYVDPGVNSDGVGYQAILERLGEVETLRPAESTGIQSGAMQRFSTEAWGRDVQVDLLSANQAATVTNDASVVLRIEFAGKRILLTGDALEGLESSLVSQFGGQLRANVLKAAHHAGQGTNSQAFLDQVFPETDLTGQRYAVISAGARANLPAADVLERLQSAVGAANLYRTDRADEDKSQGEAPGDDHVLLRVTSDGNLSLCYAFPDASDRIK